jgi:putative hemolysin
MLVEECGTGRLACTFRLLPLRDGAGIGDSYAAQHYDLGALAAFAGPLLEMGRFCIDPDLHDADILRVAWGALTRHVDATGARLLFGCSSFPGTDTSRFLDAFAILRDRHLAPACWRPGAKAAEVFPFACAGAVPETPDARRAVKAMPPLLRTYLAMGGWVSDHAVVDRDLGTLHVFTGLEVAAIPPARARALRAVAG